MQMLEHPAGMQLPSEFKRWTQTAQENLEEDFRSRPQIAWAERMHEAYESGLAGAFKDPVAAAEFESSICGAGGSLDGSRIAEDNGLRGAGEGRLVIPFQYVEKYFPGCWPGPAQQRGDCTSHAMKNAALLLLCCDIASGRPDEVSRVVEGVPEVDPIGIANGVLSTEFFYWYRGYNGDGWSCEGAAGAATKNGMLLRNNYPDLGLDLRKYSGSLAGKYGSRAPGSEITNAGRLHLIRTSTRLASFEDVRDYLANGFGVSSCGGEGFSNVRDENGVSRRSGSWAHAMGYIGADDRDVVKQKYGDRLVCILNSWNEWNSGPRRIMGTDIDIPKGAMWVRWNDVKNRTVLAFSGANGWAAKSLPPIALSVG